MNRAALVPLLVLLAARAPRTAAEELPPQLVARTAPLSPEEERARLRLPPGFEAQLVAAEPQISKPMNLAFDDRGRLWVTDTLEYPFPVKEGERGRDAVKVLEDTDGDGRADRVTTFAEGLNIPIGVLPIPGGAIVYTIPALYRFIDRDGDDRADERVVLYEKFGHGDTHGMVNGLRFNLDGWLYACHGFSNTSEVRGTDGSVLQMNSGNTFRMRLDGSRAEQFTRGQVNPFGLCFDPWGNAYTADCHSQPGYLLLRGAWYPSFGKPHDGLGYGPTLMQHDHGSTAICGIVHYSAEAFPEEYRGTLFIGNVVTNRINHDRLERRGSTLKAREQPDFLVSEDPWFRPVDLRLGPDGALYVADFYNRIIGHYEVPLTHPGRDRDRGRIWRIVHSRAGDAGRRPFQDLRRQSAESLVDLLGHSNQEVRALATHELARRGDLVAVERARQGLASASHWRRLHSLWVLERSGALEWALMEAAARDGEALVRVHLQRVLSERPRLAEKERDLSLAALRDADGFVRRAAAEVLGRHPSRRSFEPLLELRRQAPAEDTFLLHQVRMSLRDHLRSVPGIWEEAALRSATEVPLLTDVALGVQGPEAANFILAAVHAGQAGGPPGPEVLQHLARHLPEASRAALAGLVRAGAGGTGRRVELFKALQRGADERGYRPGEEVLSEARKLAAECLESPDPNKARQGLELVRSLKLGSLEERLRELARSTSQPEENRRLCLEALTGLDAARHMPLLREVLADAGEGYGLREHAAQELGNIRRPEAVEALAGELAAAPYRLAARIAGALARSPEGVERLLQEIGRGKATARLLRDREVGGRVSRSALPGIRERVAELTAGLPEEDAAVEKLIARRKEAHGKARPDPGRGGQVYEKSCAPCHKPSEKGFKIGPDLTGIGLRGLDRLLEDVLDPSRNVDRAFSTTVVVQKDNLVRTGLLLSEEGEALVLADQEGKEVRISKAEVAMRETTPLSPMPANFAETIPEEDFHHLLGYLLAQRAKADPAAAGAGTGGAVRKY